MTGVPSIQFNHSALAQTIIGNLGEELYVGAADEADMEEAPSAEETSGDQPRAESIEEHVEGPRTHGEDETLPGPSV